MYNENINFISIVKIKNLYNIVDLSHYIINEKFYKVTHYKLIGYILLIAGHMFLIYSILNNLIWSAIYLLVMCLLSWYFLFIIGKFTPMSMWLKLRHFFNIAVKEKRLYFVNGKIDINSEMFHFEDKVVKWDHIIEAIFIKEFILLKTNELVYLMRYPQDKKDEFKECFTSYKITVIEGDRDLITKLLMGDTYTWLDEVPKENLKATKHFLSVLCAVYVLVFAVLMKILPPIYNEWINQNSVEMIYTYEEVSKISENFDTVLDYHTLFYILGPHKYPYSLKFDFEKDGEHYIYDVSKLVSNEEESIIALGFWAKTIKVAFVQDGKVTLYEDFNLTELDGINEDSVWQLTKSSPKGIDKKTKIYDDKLLYKKKMTLEDKNTGITVVYNFSFIIESNE